MKKNVLTSRIALIGAIFALTGCDINAKVTPKSISISDPMAFTYKVGDVFDSYINNGGLTVDVLMSDNSTVRVEKGLFTYTIVDRNDSTISIDPTKSFSQTGTYVVTVSKDNLASVTENITVSKADPEPEKVTLTSISASNYTNEVYVDDEYTFDGTVTATFSDGSKKDVTNDATIGEIETTSAGTKTGNISYTSNNITKTTTYSVSVKNKPIKVVLESIALEPTSFTINQGDTFDFKAIVEVIAHYSDDTTEDVTDEAIIPTFDTNTVGTKSYTIKYTEDGITKSSNFSLTVNKKEENIPVTGVEISQSSLSVNVGKTSSLSATVLPSNATNKSVTWSSSSSSIASVSSSGVVTGVSKGSATITVKTVDGNYTKTCSVTVSESPAYDTISVDEAISIIDGLGKNVISDKEYYIKGVTASVEDDSNGYGFNGVFANSILKFKSVQGNGIASKADEINGKEVIILGYIENYNGTYQIPYLPATYSPTGSKYNPKLIYVEAGGGGEVVNPTNITVSPVSKTISVNEAATLAATVSPENATDKSVTWSTSDSNICTVSTSGLIKGVAEGSATITATTSNGLTATCAVTVKNSGVTPIEGDKFDIEFNKFGSDGQTELTSSTILEQIVSGEEYINSFTSISKIFKGTNGLKFGSSKVGGSLAFELADSLKELNVKEIILELAQYTTVSSTVSIYDENETQLGSGSSSDSTVTATLSTPKQLNSIEISSSARAYLSKITFVCETAVKIPVTAISIPTSKNISIGNSEQLSVTYTPSDANTGKTITWKSDNTSIATVSNGLVSGVAAGTTTITATSANGCVATCSVTVAKVSVTGVTLSKTSENIGLNSTLQLTANVLPSNATDKTVTWSSSAATVATVSSSGLVTANAVGSATITVKTNDGNFSATCSITVSTIAVTGVSLSSTSETLKIGNTKQLTATVSPSTATNKTVTWSSSATKVATVSSTGLVEAVAAGSATITVKTNDGSKTATCNITVEETKADAWTIMIYMCGADLESQSGLASGDIKEILSVSNQPDNVNIVIETGGAKSWSLGSTYLSGATSISNSKLSRWHVEGKKLVLDTTLTNASMGKATTLQSFVEYGINNYPADKTGVIMWNHGGAMYGCCYDEKYNDDSLSNSEMKSAFSSALSSTGSSKLEFVGYDTCLTQVQDIAEFNSNYFNYMIASEESEAGEGWDYDTWIDDVYSNKSTSAILTAIVDGFITDNGGQSSSSGDQTLSWLDLSAMEAYKTAFENFATALKSQLSSKSVTKATFASWMSSKVKAFCVDSDEDEKYFCLFDVKDMINKISSNTTYNPGSSYITALNIAFNNLVKYNVAQKGAGNAYGIGCIYCQASTYSSYLKSAYTSSETGFTNWFSFLKTYSYLG